MAKTRWVPTRKRFVAFMDIMGFKDWIYREPHESVLDRMQSLQLNIEALDSLAEERLKIPESAPANWANLQGPLGRYPVKPVLFSDSILFISMDDSARSFFSLLFDVRLLINCALAKQIPVKGAIAYGMQTADLGKALYFGRPLIDAYELQNDLLLYGVVLHHSAEHYVIATEQMPVFEGTQLLNKYQTPFKGGDVTHYVVGYRDDQEMDIPRSLETLVSRLYQTVSGPTRCYVDNTLDFAIWFSDRHERRVNESTQFKVRKKKPQAPAL